ncbi:MAG TPA: diacylglycerol kinase family protein [Candidatus Nanopelagicales bacterium]|nr:diacylglycerol kinase family protein [Candidatus Nanopelagicales bacterium]
MSPTSRGSDPQDHAGAAAPRQSSDPSAGVLRPASIPPPTNVSRDRIAVVVNGNAKSVTGEVIERLDQILDSGDLFVSRRVEDSERIARTLVDRGYGTILTGGGDGTFTVVVTSVVNEARRRGAPLPRFGLLRLGTGNSLAWVLGASNAAAGRGLAADLQRLRADAGSRDLRLVEAEGVLSPFCGFGIDAVMLRDYNQVKSLLARGPFRRWAPGPVAYTVAAITRTIPNFIVSRTPHCRVINEGSEAVRVGEKGSILGAPIPRGGIIYEGPARIVALSTIPYYGFGFRMFPYAEDRPDRMQLRVSIVHPFTFIRHFGEIWRGEYDDLEIIFDYFVDDVTIEMDPVTSFQIGGDVRGERSRVRMRLTEPIRIVDFYAPPRG